MKPRSITFLWSWSDRFCFSTRIVLSQSEAMLGPGPCSRTAFARLSFRTAHPSATLNRHNDPFSSLRPPLPLASPVLYRPARPRLREIRQGFTAAPRDPGDTPTAGSRPRPPRDFRNRSARPPAWPAAGFPLALALPAGARRCAGGLAPRRPARALLAHPLPQHELGVRTFRASSFGSGPTSSLRRSRSARCCASRASSSGSRRRSSRRTSAATSDEENDRERDHTERLHVRLIDIRRGALNGLTSDEPDGPMFTDRSVGSQQDAEGMARNARRYDPIDGHRVPARQAARRLMTTVWDGAITAEDWQRAPAGDLRRPRLAVGHAQPDRPAVGRLVGDHRDRIASSRWPCTGRTWNTSAGKKSAVVAGDNFDRARCVREPQGAAGSAPDRVQRPLQRVHLARHRHSARPWTPSRSSAPSCARAHGPGRPGSVLDSQEPSRPGARAPRGAAPPLKCRTDRVDLGVSRATGSTRREEAECGGIERKGASGAGREGGQVVQTEAHLPKHQGETSRAAAARATAEPGEPDSLPGARGARVARHYHFIADEPLWLILGAMVLTQLVTTTHRRGVPARHARRPPASAADRADRADRALRVHERVGLVARGRVRVRGRDRDPRRRLALRGVGDGPDRGDGRRG